MFWDFKLRLPHVPDRWIPDTGITEWQGAARAAQCSMISIAALTFAGRSGSVANAESFAIFSSARFLCCPRNLLELQQ
jgi:hypothetical protein